MLLTLRWSILHQLLGIQFGPMHLRTGKGPAGTLNADGLLDNFKLRTGNVTPMMRLYLPRVKARLRGITAWWFCRKKGHLHTIPCNEQEWDKESWLTIATSHNT